MLRWRLNTHSHGSEGFTSVRRVVALLLVAGFFVVGTSILTHALYDGRMMPGVKVANKNIGNLTVAQARKLLTDDVSKYRLALEVADERYDTTAKDLGVTFDIEATLRSAYASGRSAVLLPILPSELELSYHVDRSVLDGFTKSVAAKVGTAPVDAAIVAKAGKFETIPEKSGWSIDASGLARLIEEDFKSPRGTRLKLMPREQTADVVSSALGPTIEKASQLTTTHIVLTFGERRFTPSQSEIGQWLLFEKASTSAGASLNARVDSSKLKNYVQNVANALDVAPVNKKVNIENGVSKTMQEGVEGLAIDQDAITKAVATAIDNRTPLVLGITSRPVAFKTTSTNLVSLDLGRYIEVNIAKQHLWVWQDHTVIYDSPITSGAAKWGFDTAEGLFSVYYKTTNTRLRGYQYGWDYDVAVKYWMPFYKGFGMHDASWRNGKFGGSDWYANGSHGCVNLPDATAEFVYNWATIGTPVWVHH